jgi:cation transport regulator ChaC
MVCFIVWTKHQSKMAKLQIESTAALSAEKAAQYSSQVQQLEDRVRVLERIATDRGQDIAHQIEKLRDWPAEEKA